MWCVADLTPEYRRRMGELLDLYEKPPCPAEPTICFDEKPVVLRGEVHDRPQPTAAPGCVRKRDFEYERRGTANVFCAVEPKTGRNFIKATARRTAGEFADALRWLAASYPSARRIHLVMDNLNTHREESLIARFGAAEGRRLWRRFAVHYTPKHASWLNQAEIELSRLSRECLGKERVASLGDLVARSSHWSCACNADPRPINWMFTRRDARKKFGSQNFRRGRH